MTKTILAIIQRGEHHDQRDDQMTKTIAETMIMTKKIAMIMTKTNQEITHRDEYHDQNNCNDYTREFECQVYSQDIEYIEDRGIVFNSIPQFSPLLREENAT